MKKISTLIPMCVCIIGIVTIFSGAASALLIIEGDPYEGNSWHQPMRVLHVERFNRIEMFLSGGVFKKPNYLNNSSWNTNSYSNKYLLLGGSAIKNLLFEVIFEGSEFQPLNIFLQFGYGDKIKEKWHLSYLGKGRGWSASASVPDADIMWLLGPAFIMLGILGRRKVKKYL